ncbi:MAG TPA: hypothetical protein ENM97_05355 [Moorella mulderi]|nr:hypothetical protein [Moorella mulderi]
MPRLNNPEMLKILRDLEKGFPEMISRGRDFWRSFEDLELSSLWEEGGGTLRFTPYLQETPAWDALWTRFGWLEETLTVISARLNRLGKLLSEWGAQELSQEVNNFGALLTQWRDEVARILEADLEREVAWLEKGERGGLALRLAPLEVGSVLAEELFAKKRAVIMTSATLRVGGGFDYFSRQVGLEAFPREKVDFCQVDSPFDYARQALVCLVEGLPSPAQPIRTKRAMLLRWRPFWPGPFLP